MAFTTLPGLVAGDVLTGDAIAAIEAAITELRPLTARVSPTFSLATGSTTLADVTGLVVTPRVSRAYEVFLVLGVDNLVGTTEDIKVGFTFPAGAALDLGSVGGTAAGVGAGTSTDMSIVYQSVTSGSTAFIFGASTGNTTVILSGYFSMGTTAGNLQVQAAQNTSGANATRILNNSILVVRQVG